jgi:acetyl esterase/lipase
MFRYLAALAVVVVSGCSTYDLKSDLSYDKTNVPYGVFDWYRPINLLGSPLGGGPKGLPCVVLIHGGAWEGGNKTDMESVASVLCAHGYICVSPNYHLTSDLTMPNNVVVKGAPWPAQFNDLETFLTYLHNNAGTFGVNPDKIASLGISAGGHLAQMLHLRTAQFNTITACDLDGETDLTPPGAQVMFDYGDIMQLAGGIAGVTSVTWADPAQRNAAQKAVCADMSTVPLVTKFSHIFINHGEGDPNIYVAQADELATKCKALNVDYDYVRLTGSAGVCHGTCWEDPVAESRLIAWLDAHLK